MTVTIGETDLELIEYLDFDFVPQCEALVECCPNTAAWKVTWSCCGYTALICGEHKVQVIELELIYGYLQCTICNNDMNFINWTRL